MSEPPAATQRSRPSRAWYVVAFVPFLLSLIPAYLLGQAAADEVAVRLEVVSGETVDLESDDRSLYAASQDMSERARCVLRSAAGKTIDLDRTDRALSTEQDETTWWRVAPLPSDLEAGTYALRCRVGGEAADPTSFAVSASPRWGRFAMFLIAAFAVPVAAAVLGTLIFVAILAMRRRAERSDDHPTQSPIQLEE